MYSFCTFWDQSTLLWQYITKHSASNAEELNLHHEKHELLIMEVFYDPARALAISFHFTFYGYGWY